MQQVSSTNPAKDTPQPLANIKEISLELLKNGDEAEAAKLFHACNEDGVFYLNLRNFDGTDGHLLRTSSDIYQLSKELFDLAEDEKMKYDIDLFGGDMKLNGYKPIGRNLGGIRGKKDGFESYAISKDTILRLTPASSSHPHPDPVSTHLPVLHAFTLATASATTAILSSLSTTLGLPGAGFNAHHRLAHPSPDMLRLLKYAAQPAAERGAPQNAHTDLGTLTVLFTAQAGLQRKKGDGGWEYVEPRPGCAVVNVGDGLEALSGGVLRSCVHRVVPVEGRGMEERWSFAYMQRAEEGTVMRGLEGGNGMIPVREGGEVLTSGEWLRRKFGMLRKETHRAEEEWVITGRKTG
ncbi:hypothetical protein MMC12_006235 [Neofusicoccum parvum]|uniref:Uncharacterized protein n=1 Tax=Neofusicoccum parvum TaxID=310453 RepID=A0ACB5SI78_9PEZI|nr:hypothetical protein MMC12_006235 [Neofusicoccum parvum]